MALENDCYIDNILDMALYYLQSPAPGVSLPFMEHASKVRDLKNII